MQNEANGMFRARRNFDMGHAVRESLSMENDEEPLTDAKPLTAFDAYGELCSLKPYDENDAEPLSNAEYAQLIAGICDALQGIGLPEQDDSEV